MPLSTPQLRACLHPLRLRLLEAVSRVPGSSLSLARRLGESQPRVHYHLRRLEEAGLVRLLEERRKRGATERLLGADPEAYAAARRALSPEEGSTARPDAYAAEESRTLRLNRGQAKRLHEDLLKLLRQYQAGDPRGEEYVAGFRLSPRS